MIKVFNGKWRGLGETEKAFGMILDFKFREIIHLFSGAELKVFIAIALHADENGKAYPGYDLLEKETGLHRSTVATALNSLCEMRIEDNLVLLRYRERDSEGKFVGGNKYIIFPTKDDIQSTKNPTMVKPNVGENRLEVKPGFEVKPSFNSSAPENGAKPPKKKTNLTVICEELEESFSKLTNIPLPDWDKDPAFAQKRWRTPIKRMYKMADKDLNKTKQLMSQAVNRMRRGTDLDLSAPRSIESSFTTVFSQLEAAEEIPNAADL